MLISNSKCSFQYYMNYITTFHKVNQEAQDSFSTNFPAFFGKSP